MKSFTILAFGLGLAAAQSVAPAPVAVDGGAVDPNSLSNVSAIDPNAVDPNAIDPNAISADGLDASSLGLSGLDVNGLDLSSVDLSNQDDIVEAILAMMAALCLQNEIEEEQLLELGQSDDLDMFLELAELMELEQSGLINLVEIQSLVGESSLFSGFNAGVLKRGVAEFKKVCFSVLFRPTCTSWDGCCCLVSAADSPHLDCPLEQGPPQPDRGQAPVVRRQRRCLGRRPLGRERCPGCCGSRRRRCR